MLAQDQTFSGVTIALDGASFYRCTFENCTLTYSGLMPVTLENNRYVNCRWNLVGPAKATLDFMGAIYKLGFSELMERTFDLIRSQKPAAAPSAPKGNVSSLSFDEPPKPANEPGAKGSKKKK